MTMSARFFQYYLDNVFKFPREIKNDIIYCQRAIKAHIKVHQLLVDKFKPETNTYTTSQRRTLQELETEIYEINAEQQYLLLRLRRVIDEFYKSVQRSGMPVDTNATNLLIAKEVVPFIDDESLKVIPVSVLFRNTEDKLMAKYFETSQDTEVIHILDTTDEGEPQVVVKTEKKKRAPATLPPSTHQVEKRQLPSPPQQQQSLLLQPQIKQEFIARATSTAPPPPNGMLHAAVTSTATSRSVHSAQQQQQQAPPAMSQMSLLKPMSQRIVATASASSGAGAPAIGIRNLYPEPQQQKQISLTPTETPSIELPVSKNVTLSRLNLRQALKKARTNILTKPAATGAVNNTNSATAKPAAAVVAAAPPTVVAAAPATARSMPPTVVTVAAAAPTTITQPPIINKPKAEPKIRATAASKAAKAAAAAAAVEQLNNSSSEDSNIERDPTPTHFLWSREPEEYKTQPADYGQEMFLRLFGLFTPEMHVQMQQRRSKRKRRTVHNNERADFHYGRIEYGLPSVHEEKKRRKDEAFLLSPQVKRGLQNNSNGNGKRGRRPNVVVDKQGSAESAASRSSSSSPDEKRACNECLKGRGSLDQCDVCKGYFHTACLPNDTAAEPPVAKRDALSVDHVKHCPACSRNQTKQIKKEAKQYASLNSTVHVLEAKLYKEKQRRASLQYKSKLYKIQMRNLFNIVNTIKSDNENDSSE